MRDLAVLGTLLIAAASCTPAPAGWGASAPSTPATSQPAASPPAPSEPATPMMQVTDHMAQPICRMWEQVDTAQATDQWTLVFDAKTPAACIPPGGSKQVPYTPDDTGTLTLAASEQVTGDEPGDDTGLFTMRNGESIVFEDPAKLPEDAIEDPDQSAATPMTIEGRARRLATMRRREHKEENRERRRLEKERATCFADVAEPTDRPRRIAIAGKWSCSATGGHASLRVIGSSGSAFDVAEELSANHAPTLSIQLSGHVHGTFLWSASGDGNEVVALEPASGGLRGIEVIWTGQACLKFQLLCTR